MANATLTSCEGSVLRVQRGLLLGFMYLDRDVAYTRSYKQKPNVCLKGPCYDWCCIDWDWLPTPFMISL